MEFEDIRLTRAEREILKNISKNQFFTLSSENLQETKDLIRLHLAESYAGSDGIKHWVRLTEFGKRYLIYLRQSNCDKIAPLLVSALSLLVSIIALVKSFFFT